MQFKDFFTSNTVIELICFFVSLLCLRKDRNRVWKYFSFYLFITCVTELYAVYLRKHHHNNQWPYNILIVFEAIFTSLMFGDLFKRYFNSKPYILGGILLLAILYFVDLEIHGFMLLNSVTNNAMSILFSLYALSYFYLLLKDDDYIDLKFSANFWWVIGVLLFYFGSTAINLYRGIDESKSKQDLCYYILDVFIVIMYSCWSYSFICKKWLQTSIV